ncbi:MAG TPA: hypothetical protein DD990_03970, partial [Cyanobacteria bacterium UBA11368]|nr:hypothetical protein [Cyanobacteria bacterium UBA11368]
YEGEFNTEQQTQLVIEYFVPGARWTPTYVCRLDSANSTANIAVRALICQRTGEDWSGVRLELSTALPMTWCALPELPSLRLGKAQPVVRKTGWRRPPIGAEILFEDYDRQKKMALAGVRKESAIADFSAPFLPSLPSLLLRQSVSGVEVITHNRLPQTTNSKAGSTSLIALNFSPFGNKVVASGYVNPDQMHQAIIESRKSGRPLTEVLESLTGRQLPPELLRQYKKQQLFELKTLYGVEPLDTEINQIPTEQVNELIENLIPVDICRRYNLIPLAKNDTQPPSILVAMVNPDNLQALDDLNRILRPQGIELQRMVITMDDYQQLINGYLNELSDRSAAPPSSAAKPASAAPGFLRGRRQAKSAPAGQVSDQIQVLESFSFTQEHAIASNTEITEYSSNYIAYGLMQLGAANDKTKRGKLSLEQRNEVYLEILQRQKVVVNFDITQVIQQAVTTAESCLYSNLPPGGIKVREVAGSFDYAYSADGRLDVPSDGQFHSVALTNKTTNVDVRYIVVPREDTNVFRIAQLRNPLAAPLLSGSADVYVDGEYILSTNIATVPPKGKMEIGLGVEQAIKVARNTFYQESRAGTILVAFNEMQHKISIEIANRLSKEARIEVRERIPVPQENAKVDVQIDSVSPAWEKYEQEERGTPIRGGYRWRVKVPGGRKAILSA